MRRGINESRFQWAAGILPAPLAVAMWLGALGLAGTAWSVTIHVPADQPTIQAGIDAAFDGDTVLVALGMYIENVICSNKSLVIVAPGGPAVTFIQAADQNRPIVQLGPGSWGTIQFDGFSVHDVANASGIVCSYYHAIIQNCNVYNCSVSGDGGGLLLWAATPVVRNCTIWNNHASNLGGGICLSSAYQAKIEDCIIRGNTGPMGSGIAVSYPSSVVEITGNYIYNNEDTGQSAAGIYHKGRSLRIVNNTIVGNAIGVAIDDADYTLIQNSIVANNARDGIRGITRNVYPSFCDLWHNGAIDTLNYYGISADPLFVDPSSDDYSLLPESPCIDHGSYVPDYDDPDGSQSDIGAFAYMHEMPFAVRLNFGIQTAKRLVDSQPVVHWSYYDSSGTAQQAIEIQVGTPQVPFAPDLWASGILTSLDTSVQYAGPPLADGEEYLYRIRLYNGINWGGWTYSRFQMNIPPGVPAPKSPINDASVGAAAVQVAVDTASNPDSDTAMQYSFQLFSAPDTVGGPIQVLENKAKPYAGFFTNLEIGKRYWWRARAYDHFEYSPWSDLVSFVTRANGTVKVPSDFATIQAAIDAASAHDTVLIAAGTYRGSGNRDLVTRDKPMVFMGAAKAESVVIDCQGSAADPHRAFVFRSSKDTGIVIKGLKLTSGFAEQGGAVACVSDKLRFEDCIFSANHAVRGGVVAAEVGSGWGPIFRNCTFNDNRADFGGGVAYHASGQKYVNCRFTSNHSPQGSVAAWLNGQFDSCAFDRNTDAVIVSGQSTFRWCLFARNNACLGAGEQTLSNCTFYGNTSVGSFYPTTGAVMYSCLFVYNTGISNCCCDYPRDPPTTFYLDHCMLYGNTYDWGGCFGKNKDLRENKVADPRLCDTTGIDFGLSANSPCIGAGIGGTNIGASGVVCASTDVEGDRGSLPLAYQLLQNYPNPFNPSTTIEFTLPKPGEVRLVVYNLLGQQVSELINERFPAGQHSVVWNGRDEDGAEVSSGIYFYRVSVDSHWMARKMLLLK